MRRLVLTALITCLVVGTAAAQSCEKQGGGRERQAASWRCQDELREEVQRDGCASKAVTARKASRFTVRPGTASWRSA